MLKPRGFTLIEVIVSITIFSIIGVGCYQVLHGLTIARDSFRKKTDELRIISHAMMTISSDFTQVDQREVMDSSDKKLPAISNENKDFIVEFTRHGYKNPLMIRRSELVRITYSLRSWKDIQKDDSINKELILEDQDNLADEDSYCLVRSVYPILDQVEDIKPSSKILMSGISEFKIYFFTEEKKWETQWPLKNPAGNLKSSGIPYGIKIDIESTNYGKLERLLTINPPPSAAN